MDTASASQASPTYPVDIITAIVSQVNDPKTLLSLCLTNHFVGHEGRRWLYRDLDAGPYKPEFHLKRLSSLLSNPSLPPLVQSFTLVRMTRPAEHTEDTLYQLIEEEPDYTERMNLVEQLLSALLEKALPRMVNLRELEYCSRSPGGTTGLKLLLAPGESTTFHLQMLRWGNSWDDHFIDFIKTQKYLKALALGSGLCPSDAIINHRIPQDICDGLAAISGDQRVVEAILPFALGVKSVVLDIGKLKDGKGVFGSKVDLKVTGPLAKAMPQLTRLTLHNYTTRISIATFGAEALRGLRVLAVDSILPEYASTDMALIGQIPNLELFIQLYSKPGAMVLVNWCRLATRLFKQSASLNEVVMLSYDPTGKVAPRPFWFFLRRGALVPRKLDWPERNKLRFLMPANEREASDPGWIDEGPLDLPREAQQLLQD